MMRTGQRKKKEIEQGKGKTDSQCPFLCGLERESYDGGMPGRVLLHGAAVRFNNSNTQEKEKGRRKKRGMKRND